MTYIRNFKYVPPVSLYLMMLIINYTYRPNPIMDSYSFTSLILFFMMGWITITIFHSEDPRQSQITLFHAKSIERYHISLFLNCLLFGLGLSVLSVMYPVVFGAFGNELRLLHIIMGLLNHFCVSLLSISLTVFFVRELTRNRGNTWWGVLTVLIGTFVIAIIKAYILKIKGLIWLLPPLHLSLEIMEMSDTVHFIPLHVYLQFGWIVIYSSLLVGFFLTIIRRRYLS